MPGRSCAEPICECAADVVDDYRGEGRRWGFDQRPITFDVVWLDGVDDDAGPICCMYVSQGCVEVPQGCSCAGASWVDEDEDIRVAIVRGM